ncbi:transposase [Streptomyces brevispora]|uniref:transposase n=1 Tax=Streptomyces brevispora TaxID=887462 RepID=UPI00380E2B4C
MGHRIVSRAVVIATSGAAGGSREVLGVMVGDSETEAFRATFLRSSRDRGLTGVGLVISDSHSGLVKAVRQVLLGGAAGFSSSATSSPRFPRALRRWSPRQSARSSLSPLRSRRTEDAWVEADCGASTASEDICSTAGESIEGVQHPGALDVAAPVA